MEHEFFCLGFGLNKLRQLLAPQVIDEAVLVVVFLMQFAVFKILFLIELTLSSETLNTLRQQEALELLDLLFFCDFDVDLEVDFVDLIVDFIDLLVEDVNLKSKLCFLKLKNDGICLITV